MAGSHQPAEAPSSVSHWQATAEPLPSIMSPLSGDIDCDVAIIGAGNTGLSTAYHLWKRGIECVVLEAETPGYGASGRAGGVLTARFRPTFPAISKRYGHSVATRLYALGLEAAAIVDELVHDCGIDAAKLNWCGQIKAAHSVDALETLKREVAWLDANFPDHAHQILDGNQIRSEINSEKFVGGVLNAGSGSIHPLNYVIGLSRYLTQVGVPIHARTPALQILHGEPRTTIVTPGGKVRASRAVLATDAYSTKHKSTGVVSNSIIPFTSAIIATERLPDDLLKTLLPKARTYTETKRMMRWFWIESGRLLFGGRGAFSSESSSYAFDRLHSAMLEIFPQLGGYSIEHRWSGTVSMTPIGLPRVGHLRPNMVTSYGYNGVGIPMSNLMGRYIAAMLAGESVDLGPLAIDRPEQIPFRFFHRPVVRAVAGWYELLDRIK